MATALTLVAASPHIGSPVLVAITPNIVVGASFHIVKIEVTSSLQNEDSASYSFSSPVYYNSDGTESGKSVQVDISSALRAAYDDYVFTAEPTTYPCVDFSVAVWDEYMKEGVVYNKQGMQSLPTMHAMFGKMSDMERLLSSVTGRSNRIYSRKPQTMIETVTVGEQYIYPTPYSGAEDPTLSNITSGPTSVAYDITKEGAQTIVGTRMIYGVAAEVNRFEFRFINGFGVLESYSCRSMPEKTTNISKTEYAVAIQESFNRLQHNMLIKKNDIEIWKMTTDPMDESWMQWFVHEFAMASHAWVKIFGHWVPCQIVPDDAIKMGARKSSDMYSMEFSVKLDITGSPTLMV